MNNIQLGRIIIVDDEIDVMTPLCEFLSELGYRVMGYVSGKDALEALKEKDFDLLLTDLVMPEMDGITLLKAAKEIDPHLVCIIITGKGTIETAVEAMKVGAFDYIMKPLDWKILRPILSRAMEVRSLRKSEEKYRTIVEDQTELICRNRSDGIITFANEAYCRYFGKTKEELIGQSYLLFIPEKEQEKLKRHFAALNNENPAALIEHRVILPIGEIRWQQWTNRAIFDEQGDIVEFQSVGRDITERKLAEESLRKLEALEFSILSAIPHAVIGLRERRIIFANDAVETVFGWKPQELIGKKTRVLYRSDEEYEELGRRFYPVLQSQRSHSEEFPCRHKDGKDIICMVNASIIGEQLEDKGIVVVYEDITERKQAEGKLKSSHEQLRTLAKSLSKAEENERQRIARELHDQVGQNLTALGINLNMLHNQLSDKLTVEIDSRFNDSMKILEETAKRIRDVMADLRPSVLDDYGLMAAIRWYSDQFSKRTKLNIIVHGEELIPRLSSEIEITLFRIAQEVLTNVAKHAMASKVIINLAEVAGKARLVIIDDGVGFEPAGFYLSKEKNGWGLLNIRERTEALGGKLIVESEPGKGTRIMIEIGR